MLAYRVYNCLVSHSTILRHLFGFHFSAFPTVVSVLGTHVFSAMFG